MKLSPIIFQTVCIIFALVYLINGNIESTNIFTAASFVCGAIHFK